MCVKNVPVDGASSHEYKRNLLCHMFFLCGNKFIISDKIFSGGTELSSGILSDHRLNTIYNMLCLD